MIARTCSWGAKTPLNSPKKTVCAIVISANYAELGNGFSNDTIPPDISV